METTLFTQPIPPFNQIQPQHFLPALKEAIAKAEAKVQAIAGDTAPTTVQNVLVPMDELFGEISAVKSILNIYYNTLNTPEIAAISEEADKLTSAFGKTVFQNPKLAARFKAVQVPQDEETPQLYNQLAFEFEGEGAFLDEAGQTRLKAIDEELIGLANTFTQNVQAGLQANALHVTDEAMLKGLPPSMLESFAEKAKQQGKPGWVVVPDRLLVEQLLEIADNRDFRKNILNALDTVGTIAPHDNRDILKQMLALRHERSVLLGYPHYAAYALKRTMAGSVERAEGLLKKLGEELLPKLEKNLDKLTAFAKQNGGPDKLEPYDAVYWANRYKADKFGYDSAKLAEYLPIEKVVEGYFATAQKLFGVTFKPNATYPVYHPDVVAYDLFRGNELIGIVYADHYAREGKESGAWMSGVKPARPGQVPIVTLNMNQLKPTPGNPCLLSPEQAETYFHEGGHALHGLLGINTKYVGLQGTGPSSDYLEFHSMVLEYWANEGESLSTFARHHQTGDAVPQKLLEAKKNVSGFFMEAMVLRIVQNAMRDLMAHKTPPEAYPGDKALEDKADFPNPSARALRAYPLARFTHLFSDALSGYAAGYYGYVWSQVLAANGFEKFRARGLFDAATASNMAKLYSYGASRETNKAFEEFNEGPIRPEALLAEMEIDLADAA